MRKVQSSVYDDDFGGTPYLFDLLSMTIILAVMSKLRILWDLWAFMKVRKQWWLLPLLLVLLVLGSLLVFAQSSPLAPFIYTFI